MLVSLCVTYAPLPSFNDKGLVPGIDRGLCIRHANSSIVGIVGIQKTRDYRDSKNVKEQGNTSGKNRHRNVATSQRRNVARSQGRNVARCKALHKATRPPQHLHRSLRQFSTAIFIHLRLQLMHLHFTLYFTVLHSASYDCFWKQQDSVNLFNILFFGHKCRVERLELLSTSRARLRGLPLARLHQRVHAEAKSRLCPVTRLALKIFDAHRSSCSYWSIFIRFHKHI